MRPIGYFVHHQGRGHAERCAALVNALPVDRPVVVFCARPRILPPLRAGARIVRIPSLFEPTGGEAVAMDHVPTPDTVHCAPLGWPGIREAMGTIAQWFREADPALIICDVSAEVAQLARLCSVPHVGVIQHGDRTDPGHLSANAGAAGLLAPFHRRLAQPEWPVWQIEKTHFSGGLGVRTALPARVDARCRLGVADDQTLIVAISGAGGNGIAQAPLGVGARTFPDAQWITIGPVQSDWHATEPGNLRHAGWVDDPEDYIAAADMVISSTGNTLCQQILTAGRPWIAVPEWRYFDEQIEKAKCLQSAGVALHLSHLPSSAHGWRDAMARAHAGHDPMRQRAMIDPRPDRSAAHWIEALVHRLWRDPVHAPAIPDPKEAPHPMTEQTRTVSAVTIARGRVEHLSNVVVGLSRQTRPPMELIVGVMQNDLFDGLPETKFPIRQIRIPGDALPLSRARNVVASLATGEVVAFVDVDCIPAPELIDDYASACAPGSGLMMGEVLYLPSGAAKGEWAYRDLEKVSVRHSDRRGPPEDGVELCSDYRCFWSLNFAMNCSDFTASGGFDERYDGYGGEDTDFGRTLVEKNIPISWIKGARVYHQYHPHYMPPVHHLASVLRNAETFASKWGHRTMEHWLHCFRLMGLIENTASGLRVLRAPGAEDFALSRQQAHMPYANTRRVMDILESRRRAIAPGVERQREIEAAQKSMLLPAAE